MKPNLHCNGNVDSIKIDQAWICEFIDWNENKSSEAISLDNLKFYN